MDINVIHPLSVFITRQLYRTNIRQQCWTKEFEHAPPNLTKNISDRKQQANLTAPGLINEFSYRNTRVSYAYPSVNDKIRGEERRITRDRKSTCSMRSINAHDLNRHHSSPPFQICTYSSISNSLVIPSLTKRLRALASTDSSHVMCYLSVNVESRVIQ